MLSGTFAAGAPAETTGSAEGLTIAGGVADTAEATGVGFLSSHAVTITNTTAVQIPAFICTAYH